MGEPNYYAVIPADVRYDGNLSHGAKLLYGEITALCNQKGFCWASNNYFAGLYGTTEKTIRNWIHALNENGYINVNLRYKEGTKMIESRCISLPVLVGKLFSEGGEIISEGVEEIFQRCGKNFPKGMEKNFLDNNTSTNITSNTTLKENTKRKSGGEATSLGLEFDAVRLFESFWKNYPKKIAKKDAEKSFVKACRNQDIYNTIMKALTTQIVVNKWDEDNHYCPKPTTWLNQERWNDEVEVKPDETDKQDAKSYITVV